MNNCDKPPSAESPSESTGPEDPENIPPAETGKAAGNDYAALLDAHKGKLAVGVAATLGLLIYYNLKKKTLPEEDPEGYARLQKLKDQLRLSNGRKSESKPPKPSARQPEGIEPIQETTGGEKLPDSPPEPHPDRNGK